MHFNVKYRSWFAVGASDESPEAPKKKSKNIFFWGNFEIDEALPNSPMTL